MPEIQIDEAVYDFLQKAARPFEELTPNDVLRRLLLEKDGGRPAGIRSVAAVKEELVRGLKEALPDPQEVGTDHQGQQIHYEKGYGHMSSPQSDVIRDLDWSPGQLAALRAAGVKVDHLSAPRTRRPVASTASFVERLLKEKFSGEFKKVGRYRYMRESDSQIVYFQNFNKAGSPNLWYRLNQAAMETLGESPKEGFVCLTNPAERLSYILPLQALQSRLERKYPYLMDGDLEVNIDHANGVWRELEWKIDDAYLIRLEKIED